MSRNKHGQRHIDRLIAAIFDVLEDTNQSPELRVKAAELQLAALERRTPPSRKKKSPEVRAVELLMGAPKRQTPFVTNNPNPPKNKPAAD